MSVLLPDGVEDLHDLPHPAHDAISRGLIFTSWDELEKDERPPKSIWLDSDQLEAWFKDVKAKREAKYGSDKKKPIDDPVRNGAAQGLIVGA